MKPPFIFTVLLLASCVAAAHALELNSSSLLVNDSRQNAILLVDPFKNSSTELSGDSRGVGPALHVPEGMFVATNGHILVCDRKQKALLSIDPRSGNRTIVSANGSRGNGVAFIAPRAVAPGPNNTWLVVDNHLDGIVIVQSNGDRNLLEQSSTEISLSVPVAVISEKNIAWVLDQKRRRILQVDLKTGDRSIVSDDQSTGPDFQFPRSMQLLRRGAVVVSDSRLNAIISVNLSTGARTFEKTGINSMASTTQHYNPVPVSLQKNALLDIDSGKSASLSPWPQRVTAWRTFLLRDILITLPAPQAGPGPATLLVRTTEPLGQVATRATTLPGSTTITQLDPGLPHTVELLPTSPQ